MAAGDVTVTIAIEGGDSKSGTVAKATADLAIAWVKANVTTQGTDSDGNPTETAVTTDAGAIAFEVNKVLGGMTNRANKQQNTAAVPTAKTFTEVT